MSRLLLRFFSLAARAKLIVKPPVADTLRHAPADHPLLLKGFWKPSPNRSDANHKKLSPSEKEWVQCIENSMTPPYPKL